MAKATKHNGFDFSRIGSVEASNRGSTDRRGSAPGFTSILFERPEDRVSDDAIVAPEFFTDLNCHQIVNTIVAGRDEYNLKPFFYDCLRRVDTIKYRHEVMQDLDSSSFLDSISGFAENMRSVREHLRHAEKAYYAEQKQARFLEAVSVYCETVSTFTGVLATATLKSRGFLSLKSYMAYYTDSGRFMALRSQTDKLKFELSKIEYCVLTRGNSFTVRKYEGETDYSADVEETFNRFKQGAARDYLVKFSASDDMNHIEAKILEFVAKLYPKVFADLDHYCAANDDFLDRTVAVFDREVQFYAAYREYVAALEQVRLSFCYPCITTMSAEVYDHDGFDLALAHKLVADGSAVVCNDFHLTGVERILVVSGPNQGGKTTFARAFGQLHYLASIGCPVPGTEARLLLFDQLFTHFEKEEKVENLRGKLEDDLIRIEEILGQATSQSIIIMNEIFTSTTIQDEVFLSKKVMEMIVELDALCVWVTFVDELASFGPQTVSMVSTVVPENPALRTFKVLRRPAEGLAYAMAIARKYGLTYDSIKQRIRS
jgi:DNA mismatch repair protein MutS